MIWLKLDENWKRKERASEVKRMFSVRAYSEKEGASALFEILLPLF